MCDKVVTALVLVWIFAFESGIAQTNADASSKTTVSQTRIDYAAPDAPAFTILAETPATIMRPSTTREFGFIVGNLIQEGGSIPKSFALEFAPAMMFNPTLSQYRSHYLTRLGYRTKISVGTQTIDGAVYAAAGIKLTLLDDSDLRLNDAYLDRLSTLGDSINDCISGRVRELDLEDPSFDEKCTLIQSDCTNKYKAEQVIKEERAKALRNDWNKPILEIAFAILGQSQDGTFGSLLNSRFGGWITGGSHVLFKDDFLLLSGKFLMIKSATGFDEQQGGLAARYYYGSNSFKIYGELDVSAETKKIPASTLNAGIEYKVYDGIWIVASYGLEYIHQATNDVHDVDLKFALP